MITLLAESKTMSSNQEPVSEDIFINHRPVFEGTADEIMGKIAQDSTSELSGILGISGALAVKTKKLAYDFADKSTGYKALLGFTGEAYRGLDVSSFSQKNINDAFSRLRIISSVYGLLKPDDIIKPYRCEFSKPICPGAKTPISVFKSKNTIEFVKFLKENKITEVIDLLPGDADKCLDWKIIRAFAKVHKICFQEVKPGGGFKTPIASRLKELRGKMCRDIILNEIPDFQSLTGFHNEDYVFSPEDSKPGLPVFVSI